MTFPDGMDDVLDLTDDLPDFVAVTSEADGLQVTCMADQIVHGKAKALKGFL